MKNDSKKYSFIITSLRFLFLLYFYGSLLNCTAKMPGNNPLKQLYTPLNGEYYGISGSYLIYWNFYQDSLLDRMYIDSLGWLHQINIGEKYFYENNKLWTPAIPKGNYYLITENQFKGIKVQYNGTGDTSSMKIYKDGSLKQKINYPILMDFQKILFAVKKVIQEQLNSHSKESIKTGDSLPSLGIFPRLENSSSASNRVNLDSLFLLKWSPSNNNFQITLRKPIGSCSKGDVWILLKDSKFKSISGNKYCDKNLDQFF